MKTLTSDSQILDKARLIGSCVLLPVEFDTGALLDEFFAISKNQWGTKGGRVGVHSHFEASFTTFLMRNLSGVYWRNFNPLVSFRSILIRADILTERLGFTFRS